MALRLASEETQRIDLMDDQWVEVRTDVSKRTLNKLMKFMPRRAADDLKETGLTVEEGTEFQVGVFVALVTDWSLPFPATEESYLGLDTGPELDELDEKLTKHFEAIMPSKEEQGKQ